MSESGQRFPGRRSPTTAVAGRPMVLVLEKENRWGPRLLALAGVIAVVTTAFLARWIPGAPLPDGRGWRMSGWEWLACRWHDRSMGTPGTAGFKADADSWRLRLEREPGSLGAVRGYLDSLLALGESRRTAWRDAWRRAEWLATAGGTNAADLGRWLRVALRTTDRGDEWHPVGQWVDRMAGNDRGLYLATAADHGDWEEVRRALSLMPTLDGPERIAGVAHRVATRGKGEPLPDAMADLRRTAAGSDEAALIALRLMMGCAVARADHGLASEALAGLARVGGARLWDHLQEAGLREGDGKAGGSQVTGTAMAEGRPAEWREVLPWVRWRRTHGEALQAGDALKRAVQDWDAPSCWLEAATFALEIKDWELVEQLGHWLASGTPNVRDWASLGHALRAMAMDAKGDAGASREWARMAQTPLPRNGATFDWCRMFEQVGHLSQADTWLRTLEPEKQQDIDYWRMRMRSAMGSGDTEAWLAATQRASKLAPGDVDLALDHAWGVLVLAKGNEEVLKLLDEDLVLLKGGRKGQILTAWAEARLGRLRKAESSLRSLDALVKAPGEKAILAVAWFELLSRTDRVEEAWSVYKAMDMSLLPSPTVRQIDQEATSLATRLEKKRKFDEALKAARQQP
ncbi:MAG: hypothetical protein WCR07_01290 [Verrucomicrobiota bacterium]